MKRTLYAIRDVRANEFMQPTLDLNDACAMRNFEHALLQNSVLGTHPEDFDLYKVGSFDGESGRIAPLDVVEMVCSGSALRSYARKEEQNV